MVGGVAIDLRVYRGLSTGEETRQRVCIHSAINHPTTRLFFEVRPARWILTLARGTQTPVAGPRVAC